MSTNKKTHNSSLVSLVLGACDVTEWFDPFCLLAVASIKDDGTLSGGVCLLSGLVWSWSWPFWLVL